MPRTPAAALIAAVMILSLLPGTQAAPPGRPGDPGVPENALAAGREDLNDDFNGTSLDPKWSWFNPPAAFDVGNTTPGWLHIVSPDGTNFGPGATNGTVIYQNMTGNVSLETKLSAVPANGVEKTGLILYNNETNWMALKYQVDGGGPYVEVGVQDPAGFGNLYWTPVTADPVWLRVVKDGPTLTTFYSTDGVNWTEQFNYTQSFEDPFMAGLLVSDGYAASGFSVDFDYFRFRLPNRVPELSAPLSPVTFDEDGRFAIGAIEHFRDPDGENLTFKASAPHIKGEFDPAANDFVLFGPPNWFGNESVQISATDPDGRSVTATLAVTVLPVEDPPILAGPLPPVMVLQNATNGSLELSKYFLDNDTALAGDVLAYNYSGNGPLRVAITAPGRVTLSAPIDFWGVVDMTFTATDDAHLPAAAPCTVTVAHVNQAPQVVRPDIPALTVSEDESVSMDFAPVFRDPDGDQFALVVQEGTRISLLPSPGSLNITFQPKPDDSGFTEDIAVLGRDDRGLGTNWVTVRVSVTPVNDAPRITRYRPLADVAVPENQAQEFNLTAADVESGAKLNCTWFLDGAIAEWGQTGFYYRPNFTAAGAHTVTATVSDGELSASRTWDVTVENVNLEPYNLKILSPKAGEAFGWGATVTFEGSAQDPDNDTLSFAWFDGIRALGEGRRLSVALPAGPHAVTMQVSDGAAEVTGQPLRFTVAANELPRLDNLDPASGQKFEKGARIHFRASASDADGDRLLYCWTENGRVLSTSPDFYKYDLPAGAHKIYLSVTDGKATVDTYVLVEVTQPGPSSSGPGIAIVGAIAAAAAAAGAAAFALLRWRKRPGHP